MKTLKVTKENYGIKYSGKGFGARPDLTHPELVRHELSEDKHIVIEFESFKGAFLAAHRVISDDQSQGDISIIRITHHEPYQRYFGFMVEACDPENEDELDTLCLKETVTMTITGETVISGMPHFTDAKALGRYHPVNGWVIPESIEVQ